MRKQKAKKKSTVVLSGFGAALAVVATNLAMAENAQTPPAKTVSPVRQATPLKPSVAADLCKAKDARCMMAKPFAQKLNAVQKTELKVLIAKGIQADIKDACLVC